MDDQLLARRARGGDDIAFETLVRRHTDTVWRFARTMAPDDQAAEEIVQDTFVKAYRGLASYRGDSSITTWLYSICRRTALDRGRRRSIVAVPLAAAEAAAVPDAAADDRIALDAAIAGLPDDEREAFVLCAVLGYPQEEAARLVGIPASTMRGRMSRARTRLVAVLSIDDEEEAR